MALYVGGTSVTGSQVLDATKLSGNLPALNASSLTNLDAADLSGTLPAINGSNLTNLPSSAPTSSRYRMLVSLWEPLAPMAEARSSASPLSLPTAAGQG